MTLVVKNKGIPYIGVTDFVTHEQVIQAVSCIPDKVFRRLHVGHMMSYKTFHGIPTRTGWENIWLRGEALRALFQPNSRVFNVLHWADYDYPLCLTKSNDLVLACKEAGPYLQGLQLDMIWPRPALIKEFKKKLPDIEIILQIGRQALAYMEERLERLPDALVPYLRDVDYFLIDESGGEGKGMVVARTLQHLQEMLYVTTPEKLAVAGGIGPSTCEPLRDISGLSPLISSDMQGQMRSSGKSTDPIEMDRVCSTIKRISSLIC